MKITIDRATVEQALGALDAGVPISPGSILHDWFRAALAQQDEPAQPGAWVASKDGRVIYDDSSTDDGLLRVSGDFEDDEQRVRYAKQIVDKLNAAPPQRTMVPLTEDEIDAEWRELDGEVSTMFMRVLRKFARAVEEASWEKNHGQA